MSDACAISSTMTAGVPIPTPRHQQLQKAATQFEAVMLGELMKPLTNGSALDENESGSSTTALQSYAVEAMAGALARSGALGFAGKMIRSVEAREARVPSTENNF